MKKLFSLTLAGIAITLFAIALPVSAADHGPAEQIVLTPESASIQAGDSVTFTVTAKDAADNSWDVSATSTITIESGAGGSIEGTTYTSETVGKWTVTATAGSFTDTSTVYVTHGMAAVMSFTASDDSVTAGDEITLHTTLQDSMGNSWNATGVTVFSTDEAGGAIYGNSYTPTTAGAWNITAKVAGLTQVLHLTVSPAEAEFLTISPYPGPITIELNKTKAFHGTISDTYGNAVTSAAINWGVSNKEIAEINEDGIVTAKKGGKVTITASVGDILLSIPVEVFDPVVTVADTTEEEGQVLGDSVENEEEAVATEETESSDTMSELTEESTESTEETCEPISLWVVIIILVVYAAVLAGYYFLIRKENDKSWWIFPVLLTVIGVIIWAKYFCENSYPWFPWTLILVGIIVTGLMRKDGNDEKKNFSEPHSQETPPKNQPPMF